MFADDTACLDKNDNLNELISTFNTEISKIARWFRTNKMAVNIAKTKFIIFHTCGKQIDNENLTLTYNDNEPGCNDPSRIFQIERYHNNHISVHKIYYKLIGI